MFTGFLDFFKTCFGMAAIELHCKMLIFKCLIFNLKKLPKKLPNFWVLPPPFFDFNQSIQFIQTMRCQLH